MAQRRGRRGVGRALHNRCRPRLPLDRKWLRAPGGDPLCPQPVDTAIHVHGSPGRLSTGSSSDARSIRGRSDTIMNDLFDAIEPQDPSREVMADGTMLLRGCALPFEADILSALQAIVDQAPYRHMTTPGGYVMSVAMTNCGAAGWITERTGY